MVQEGVSVPPSQFEGMFISGAHTVEDIDATIEANYNAFKSL